MSSLFKVIGRRVRQAPSVLGVFIFACAIMLIGGVLFMEDAYIGFVGLQQIDSWLNLPPSGYRSSYVALSLLPQVGQMMFIYILLRDTRRNRWALLVLVPCFLFDFVMDVQGRSDGRLFPPGGGPLFQDPAAISVSAMMVIGYFTLASELFLAAGLGLIWDLYRSAIRQTGGLVAEVRDLVADARSYSS